MTTKNRSTEGKKWLKISLQAPSQLTESVSDNLGMMSGCGVELRPETAAGIQMSAYFPLEDKKETEETIENVRQMLTELFQLYECTVPELETEIIDDQDWGTSWKRFFTPTEIVPGLIIKPSWESCQAAEGQKIIELDPGQAFGTGQHESTRMALSLLGKTLHKEPAQKALDVGTGTGILAMAATLFGVESVLAIDNDPEAVRVAGENIKANGLDSQIEHSTLPLAEVEGTVPLIMANIVHDVLVAMAPRFGELSSPNGRIILAGLLAGEQEENCLRVYQELGFSLMEAEHDGEWAALLLRHG